MVQVSGSTYRRPGARVLISGDGTFTGIISGGCFESDLLERARQSIRSGLPVTVTFDTTSPDDLVFGLGLGCTGVAQILLQPFQGSSGQEPLDFIQRCVSERKPGVLATVFRVVGQPGVSVGDCVMIGSGSSRAGVPPSVLNAILEEGRSVFKEEMSRVHTFQFETGKAEVLLEWITLPVPLLIFGAGPDAVPLSNLGSQLGWHVTIIDRRPAFARADLFPKADAVIMCEPEDLFTHVSIDPRTAVVVMTHHFETDLNFMKKILTKLPFYIGLLGPQAKAEMLLQRLKGEGIVPSPEQMSRIYSPVGLDLGAETPEEIALSIVAEIQAVQTGYPAGSLRGRSGPIHLKTPPNIPSF